MFTIVRRTAAVAALSTAMVAGFAGVAQAAASPTLKPGDHVTAPTWIFAQTTVCATSLTDGRPGQLEVDSQFPGAGPEYIEAPVDSDGDGVRTCIWRWWAGAPVDLTNTGAAKLLVEYY
ncbi:hypothetical protein [Jidongwangia harbinensis]|uniref:hypothetical protein n=1 Tax=Jidongwangia harbinensis TaxID=2878561 RepID=UPI001CD9682A|nr:hypothetical protein [Jidongwangia harbinensis]MCA2217400.1 hypothetical protein [Jidongwangia harbinensis]